EAWTGDFITLTCDHELGLNQGVEDSMHQNYDGLPAAASVEQAIVLAQLLILRDLERKAQRAAEQDQPAERELRPAA
ncbi:MAG TPA: hypothetical protein VFD73_25755, partial [Gemmatimonadales bacterium]|nr:hypothetical protein [Gemmatimonadales bacterium]